MASLRSVTMACVRRWLRTSGRAAANYEGNISIEDSWEIVEAPVCMTSENCEDIQLLQQDAGASVQPVLQEEAGGDVEEQAGDSYLYPCWDSSSSTFEVHCFRDHHLSSDASSSEDGEDFWLLHAAALNNFPEADQYSASSCEVDDHDQDEEDDDMILHPNQFSVLAGLELDEFDIDDLISVIGHNDDDDLEETLEIDQQEVITITKYFSLFHA